MRLVKVFVTEEHSAYPVGVHCTLALAAPIGETYSGVVALASSAVAYTFDLEVQMIAVEASYQAGLVVNLEARVHHIVVVVVAAAVVAFGQGLAHI